MADFNNITLRDFNSICRFCLKKDVQLNPIFKDEHNGGVGGGNFVDFFNDTFNKETTTASTTTAPSTVNPEKSVVEMINLCTGLEVSECLN